MGAIKAAVGDMVITFMWVFLAANFGLMTSAISEAFGLTGAVWAPATITTFLVFFFVSIFTVLGDFLGGASFNPTGNAAFYAAGVGDDTLISMALRVPAQALGAVGGALAILEVIPKEYRHMVDGPTLKVDPHTGAIAEGILTFIVTFAVLFIILRGPSSLLGKTWLLAVSIVSMIIAGSGYTGPAMNPAIAFGWAYVYNTHNTWEQFYVYWICPFIASILAAWVFRVLFPPPKAKKQKKA